MGDRATDVEPRIDRDDPGFDRAVAFFDATFALALTLLVTTLEIEDPGTAWKSVDSLFDAVGPQLIAYGVAFTIIAKYWILHHRLIRRFSGLDYRTIVANLFLLATIVLLPFSTASVGDPSVVELPLPVAVMAINVAAASIMSTIVYLVAVRRGLLLHAPSRSALVAYAINGLLPAAVFLASIPVAYLVSGRTAALSWISLAVIAPMLHHFTGRYRSDDAGTQVMARS